MVNSNRYKQRTKKKKQWEQEQQSDVDRRNL